MPIINGQHRYHVAVAADEKQSPLYRALAFWSDLIELNVDADVQLPSKAIENLSRTWAQMSTDYQHGDVTIEELRGFAQAFTSAAGFSVELSSYAQDAFEWIEV
ncbi:hypothetical protein D9M69_467640 [compost metagenome]